MTATVDDKVQYLIIKCESHLEEQQLAVSFTREIKNARFRAKGNKNWAGKVKYLKAGNRLPIGLWNELKKMCERFKFKLEFIGLNRLINEEFTLEEVRTFALKLFENNADITPDEEQIISIHRALKYKRCFLNGCTSSGKTLMMYVIILFLIHKKKIRKALIVSIDANLVIQANQDFLDYCAGKWNMKMGMVHGGSKLEDISDKRIVIGNFQSLSNRTPDFFEGVDILFCDEGHRGDNNSNKYINESCSDAIYKVALSGSVKDDRTAEFYDLLSYFGPIVYQITKRKWIDKGMATDLVIKVVILNYATVEQRKELCRLKQKGTDPEKIYREEQAFIRSSEVRLKWLCHTISRLNGNAVVFFLDKKTSYGKRIVEGIRAINPDKEVYYIDGDVPSNMREIFKERMEEGSNKVLVSSYDTFSTGQSVNNIHWLVLAESRKSFEVISQTLGRGMRKHESKEVCHVIDVVDDFSIDEVNYHYVGYVMKHMGERKAIYRAEELVHDTKTVDLTNANLTWQ